LQRARLGKLMQRIAQGLDTSQSPVGLRIVSALKQDGAGAAQGLQAGRCLITRRIVSDFSQQARAPGACRLEASC
jgi:hypothetical protein